VRQFITAGTADQEVPNRSIFREQFVEGLEGRADTDRDGYITGSELGMFLQRNVTNYTKGAQTPQWGKIRLPQLDRGDFVFQLVKTHVQQSDTASTNRPASNPSPPEKMPSPQSMRKSYPLQVTYESGPSYCILGNFSGGYRIVSGSIEISGTLRFRLGLYCQRPGPRRLDAIYLGVGIEPETALWSEQLNDGAVINPSRPGTYGHTRSVRFTVNGVSPTNLAKLKLIVRVDNTIVHRSGGSTQVPVYWYSKEGVFAQH
jgi:hypothetical protein